jgi:hypothetical protein
MMAVCVSFEVASLRSSQPDARVLKLRVWDYPNPTRQRGFVFLRFGSVSKNPSLTLRVMINHSVFGTMVSLMRGMRNFKTRQRGIALLRFTNVSVNPLLTRRAMIFPFISAPWI